MTDQHGLRARAVLAAQVGAMRRPGRSGARACACVGVLRYGALTLMAGLMILPFADMFIGALRGPADVYATPPRYLPASPQWGVYGRVFDELPMTRWLINSVVVTVTITVIQVATSTLPATRWPSSNFPAATAFSASSWRADFSVLPVHHPDLLHPALRATAGGNDLSRTGWVGLSGHLCRDHPAVHRDVVRHFPDAAVRAGHPRRTAGRRALDGAGEFLIFRKIVLPLLRPAVLTLTLFAFVYHWNEFIWTMTVTRASPELQTLPVGIFLLEGQFNDLDQKSLQQAALAVSVAPVLILFAPFSVSFRRDACNCNQVAIPPTSGPSTQISIAAAQTVRSRAATDCRTGCQLGWTLLPPVLAYTKVCKRS